MKLAVLAALPEGVVTRMVPFTGPAGTVAEICSALSTAKPAAATLLKVTAVAPVKFCPVMTTRPPSGAEAGVKLVITGAPMMAKGAALVAVSAPLTTVTTPELAAAGTVAVIWPALFTVKVAVVPLKRTAVAPVKLDPRMTTLVPGPPWAGAKLVMPGALVIVKFAPLVSLTPPTVTLTRPVVAAVGTVVLICVADATVKAAVVLSKRTAVAPVKFEPVMVTAVPAAPDTGVKPVMSGVAVTVKLPAPVPAPPGETTRTTPVVVPLATTASMRVTETTVNETAGVPLKVTCVAPVNLSPVSTTRVPGGPLAGAMAATVGGCALLLFSVPMRMRA